MCVHVLTKVYWSNITGIHELHQANKPLQEDLSHLETAAVATCVMVGGL